MSQIITFALVLRVYCERLMVIDIVRTYSLRIKGIKGAVLDGTVCICMNFQKLEVWQLCPDTLIYTSVLFFFPSVYVHFDVI